MSYEYAVYFKLLLLCGYMDELQQYIDNALVEQNPLSDIVLELSTVSTDVKQILSVLNEYLLQVSDTDIDYDNAVFDLIMLFLKKIYAENSLSMEDVTDLMYRIAVYTERFSEDPWYTMYYIGDLFEEAQSGYIDKEDYQHKFEAFINDKVCFCDYTPTSKKESFIKGVINKIRNRQKNIPPKNNIF